MRRGSGDLFVLRRVSTGLNGCCARNPDGRNALESVVDPELIAHSAFPFQHSMDEASMGYGAAHLVRNRVDLREKLHFATGATTPGQGAGASLR
jgi:hypothetical protein